MMSQSSGIQRKNGNKILGCLVVLGIQASVKLPVLEVCVFVLVCVCVCVCVCVECHHRFPGVIKLVYFVRLFVLWYFNNAFTF